MHQHDNVYALTRKHLDHSKYIEQGDHSRREGMRHRAVRTHVGPDCFEALIIATGQAAIYHHVLQRRLQQRLIRCIGANTINASQKRNTAKLNTRNSPESSLGLCTLVR